MDNEGYKGSLRTAAAVRSEIGNRWGAEAADAYIPGKNCKTLRAWNQEGYQVRKGEKSIQSYTFIKMHSKIKNSDGTTETVESNTVWSTPRTVNLFCWLQVEPARQSVAL